MSWIEDENGKAYVEDSHGNRADVGVVTPAYGQKYLRTHVDGRWTDNLLAFPASSQIALQRTEGGDSRL